MSNSIDVVDVICNYGGINYLREVVDSVVDLSFNFNNNYLYCFDTIKSFGEYLSVIFYSGKMPSKATNDYIRDEYYDKIDYIYSLSIHIKRIDPVLGRGLCKILRVIKHYIELNMYGTLRLA